MFKIGVLSWLRISAPPPQNGVAAAVLGWLSVGKPTQGLGTTDKWMMVTILTIIHLSPGSTQPAVHTIYTWLGKPVVRIIANYCSLKISSKEKRLHILKNLNGGLF